MLAQPGGAVVAELPKGARVQVGVVRNGHAELTLEGFVFSKSVGAADRDGMDLGITTAGGENLRAEPNGRIVARLRTGALLKKVGTRGTWTQVRRAVWIPVAALGRAPQPPAASGAPATPATAQQPAARTPTAGSKPTASGTAPATDAAGARGSAEPDATVADGATADTSAVGRVRLARDAKLHLSPDKGPFGSLANGAVVEAEARSEGWVKVKVEGWVREQDLAGRIGALGSPVTGADVRMSPAQYEGQSVEWRVQFVAVRTADELRPEMAPGQPYALVRGPLPEPGFIYLALTDAQAAEFRRLAPLAELTIRGTIRTGRTRFTGTPVLELERVTEGR